MGLVLPPELAGLLSQVGGHWPDADEDRLHELAASWRGLAAELRAVGADGSGVAQTVTGDHRGESIDAFAGHWQGFATEIEHGANAAEQAAVGIDAMARATLQAKSALVDGLQAILHRIREAHAAGLGALVGSLLGIAGTFFQRIRASLAGIVGKGPIARLLRSAGGSFGTLFATTSAAAAGKPHPGESGVTIPAAGTDARRVFGWWRGLSPDQQQRLISQEPWKIGRLNGVPAWARDKANRIVLQKNKAWLEWRKNQLKKLQKGEDIGPNQPSLGEAMWEIEDINRKLAGIEALEKKLRAIEGMPEPKLHGKSNVFLLGYDSQGDLAGHAIVSIGDPNLADNVVTYVPGFGNQLTSIGGLIDRASILAHQADTLGHGKTASIVWLGYDPPQVTNAPRAATDGLAETAVGPLNGFMDGIREARYPGTAPHTTMLGHSYGSLAVGKAAAYAHEHGSSLADDVVLVGSPGPGVGHAKDLGDPNHVWVGEAKNDPIADLPRFGGDPSEERFGAQNFRVQDDGGHSGYWDKESLQNIARIVTRDGHVQRVPPHRDPPPSHA